MLVLQVKGYYKDKALVLTEQVNAALIRKSWKYATVSGHIQKDVNGLTCLINRSQDMHGHISPMLSKRKDEKQTKKPNCTIQENAPPQNTEFV